MGVWEVGSPAKEDCATAIECWIMALANPRVKTGIPGNCWGGVLCWVVLWESGLCNRGKSRRDGRLWNLRWYQGQLGQIAWVAGNTIGHHWRAAGGLSWGQLFLYFNCHQNVQNAELSEASGWNLSYESAQNRAICFAMSHPSESIAYFCLACQSYYYRLSCLDYRQHNKWLRLKIFPCPRWHACVLKYLLCHSHVIRLFWLWVKWRHFPMLNSNIPGLITTDWNASIS